MAIDWSAAPEGTTHGMVNGGEMRWYRVGEHVECWHTKYREWIRSFFLSIEEVRDSGLYLYTNGEQSEMVTLREEKEMLLACLELYVLAAGELFGQAAHGKIFNNCGMEINCGSINAARDVSIKAITKCKERA